MPSGFLMASDQIRIVVAGHTGLNKLRCIQERIIPFLLGRDPNWQRANAGGDAQECARIVAERLRLIGEGRRGNRCRRIEGTWHYWKIFEAKVSGEIRLSTREARSWIWASPEFVNQLIARTDMYSKNLITEREWIASPGLEPIWVEWFRELRIV